MLEWDGGWGGSVESLETTETVCQSDWKRKSKRDCCCGAGGGAWGGAAAPSRGPSAAPPQHPPLPPQLITAPLQHLHPVVFLASGTLLQPAGWRECGRVCWDGPALRPSLHHLSIRPAVPQLRGTDAALNPPKSPFSSTSWPPRWVGGHL